MPLTEKTIRSAKPREKQYKLSDTGGLFLLIKPNGSRYWRWKYRLGRKEKGLALGVYPTVTLAEAREARNAARKMRLAGQDPSAMKQINKRKQIDAGANTFEAV